MKHNPDTDPLKKLPAVLGKDLEKNLCTCMDVPKIDIINAIVNGATSVDDIKKETYAAMGSGCCIQQIERLIDYLGAPERKKRRSKKHS